MNGMHLRLTGEQHKVLHGHLFPGDGMEAVAFALCGRCEGDTPILLVHRLHLVPHKRCDRSATHVTWPSDILPSIFQAANREGLTVLKVHSHPTDFDRFSAVDDESDTNVFRSAFGWIDGEGPHASAIMLRDGRLIARAGLPDGRMVPIARVTVIGDDLRYYGTDGADPLPGFALRNRQVFGDETIRRLRGLTAVIVGCSGTGSPVIEQLVRLGIGRLILVDPQFIEDKNLNRITNSTINDIDRPKVEALAEAIRRIGLGTRVDPLHTDLHDPETIRAIAGADVVFGCMDSLEGRHVLSRLCTFYTLPYIDMGVQLTARGEGGIGQIAGAVHYLCPGQSSLLSRGVYDLDQVRAEGLRRTDPGVFAEHLAAGYIRGVVVERPAVISINTLVASIAVNEFLARLHPFRLDPNSDFATTRISLVNGQMTHEPETAEPCGLFARFLGRGDATPLLGMPELSQRREAA